MGQLNVDKSTKLREIVARLAQADPASVDGGFSLTRGELQSSTGKARLDAAIRREFGSKCQAVYSAKTFRELEAAVTGTQIGASESAPDANKTPVTSTMASGTRIGATATVGDEGAVGIGGLRCGVDIEAIEGMPVADDYWNSDFYKLAFTPVEIAYCVSQAEPRQHFAARWCAKEALKKCDNTYLLMEMSSIEIGVDPNHQPFVGVRQGEKVTRLPYAVSLSHTSAFAVAMVVGGTVTASKPPTSGSVAMVAPVKVEVAKAEPPQRGLIGRLLGK